MPGSRTIPETGACMGDVSVMGTSSQTENRGEDGRYFPPALFAELPLEAGTTQTQKRKRVDPLLAQIQLLENRLVTLGSGILEVIKKTAARGNHLEKAATGGVILGVAFEVFGKIRDPLGEGGYLDIGATGVLLMQPECCDFCCFCCRHVFEDWDTSLIPAI